MRSRRLTLMVAILLFVLALSISSFAESEKDVYLSLKIDSPYMSVNGESVEIDEGRGTSPVIVEGRTLLPVRAVIEAFDGDVLWESETESVILIVGNDEIKLGINRHEAYLNGVEHVLDVAPMIINDRTMLPIRFIAESFGFGIAWDGNERAVHIVRDVLTEEEYGIISEAIPDYNGKPWVEINGNTPFFKDYELIDAPFEYYSALDELARCGVTTASLDEDMMPTEERGSISSVTPTGWINKEYDFVSGKYLYNRCHLIGYQLTGENANAKNLITGTRYLNIDGMLPFENTVDEFVENNKCRVMYRVTPMFSGDNMVAHGVIIEGVTINYEDIALSESDSEKTETEVNESVSFCVFCYNVQPGVLINYKTGESRILEEGEDIYPFGELFGTEASAVIEETVEDTTSEKTKNVYRTPSGKKYHTDKECGGVNSFEITLEEALTAGLTPCGKCAA